MCVTLYERKMGKAKNNWWTLSPRTWDKRVKVQDNAELQTRMISTVVKDFFIPKAVLISCPQSCKRMHSLSSQTLLQADSQNACQVIYRLPSKCQSRGAYNGNCCSKCHRKGKHMFRWEKTIKQRSGRLGSCSRNGSEDPSLAHSPRKQVRGPCPRLTVG